MKKILVLLTLIFVSVSVHASILDGVCFNSYGYGLRGGEYATPRCIINNNGAECASCGESYSDSTGCDGGCSGDGVGVPGMYLAGGTAFGFKCTSTGVWVPTTDDCNTAVAPTPTDTPCAAGQYKFKYTDLDSQWYCADCPTPGLTRVDDGDIRECILSDNTGTMGIISCTISSEACPSEFKDATGHFWFGNDTGPTWCSYSN